MAFAWRKNPLVYEINTWTWLQTLRTRYGQPVTLATVPDAELDALAEWGFDVIWLMGVWERSPGGRTVALEHPVLQAEYIAALPDFTPEDVIGSPYAVHRYEVDTRLGGRSGLRGIRARLNERGLGLILDFVPNHVAVDHPLVSEHPTCFIQGTEKDLTTEPDAFFRDAQGNIFAYGRDPYFPAWTDTAQLNAFNPTLRTRAASMLMNIAALCDGVRCDMAMLMTNRVFKQTWGDRAGQVPPTEFWEVIIPAVKAAYPGFVFMAEVYWDLEWMLQQQGFDYTYDKRLYDRLLRDTVPVVRGHLAAELKYQNRLVRFIENHDEARATVAFGPGRDLMAAVLVTTLPGAALLHEGQVVGHQIKLPVQLGRRPHEADNEALRLFYAMLLKEAHQPIYHTGEWCLRQVLPAWAGNSSYTDLIAYTWADGTGDRRLVVMNYSGLAAQGRVLLADFALGSRAQWRLADQLHPGEVYTRSGPEIGRQGLYVDLLPWSAHIFTFEAME